MSAILAESYLHSLDPFVIEVTPGFGLRWYGLAYAAGFVIAWLAIRWLAKTNRSPLTVADASDLMFAIILGVLVGGRLGYAAFYDPKLFVDFSGDFPFWGLLAINRGGMASHGGIIGVILACIWFGRRRSISSLHLLDVVATFCTPGLFLGRCANFINGELWGRPLPTAQQSITGGEPAWWSIKYPEEILDPGFEHMQSLAPLQSVIPGDETFVPGVIESLRAGDERVVEIVQPLLTAYYPSQVFQALSDGPILLAILAIVWWVPRKPGVVGSWFLIAYGVLRIATEFFRQPDEGVALLVTPVGEFSRGQVLSGLMVITGIVALLICARRQVPKMGGLGPKPVADS